MKIMIVMGGYFPGKKLGGPPVSVNNFCSLMKGDADCYIVTLNHDMGETKPYKGIKEGWNERGGAKVMYLTDKKYNYSTFCSIAKDLAPQFIYLQGLFQQCVIPCLLMAKKLNIRVILAPRGEICSGAFDKKYKKIPYIWFLKIFHLLDKVSFQSTSDEETTAISQLLGVKESDIYKLENIPSLPVDLAPTIPKIKGKGRFVFISRIVDKKNLLNAITFFKEIKDNVVFDIYGPIEDPEYWKKCEDAISKLPRNINVNYCGILEHDMIHHTFVKYDSFLFPTFSENYGHVIAESLLSGCVPIISDQTPWNDINNYQSGWALSLNDKDGFIKAIQSIIDMDESDMCLIRKRINIYLKEKMQLSILKESYLRLFK